MRLPRVSCAFFDWSKLVEPWIDASGIECSELSTDGWSVSRLASISVICSGRKGLTERMPTGGGVDWGPGLEVGQLG